MHADEIGSLGVGTEHLHQFDVLRELVVVEGDGEAGCHMDVEEGQLERLKLSGSHNIAQGREEAEGRFLTLLIQDIRGKGILFHDYFSLILRMTVADAPVLPVCCRWKPP